MTWIVQQIPNILCLIGSACFAVAMVLNILRSL
jgi:hypothetical protein